MTEQSAISRRVLLTAGSVGVAGASALVLAACAPGSTTTTTDNGAAASTPAASAAPEAGAATGSSGGTVVAKLADVPVGQGASVTVGGEALVVAQPTAGKVVAFSSVCPHQGCAVAFAKTDFACPCHGSNFALDTGDVTKGPAQKGLTAVSVKIDGDNIVTA